MTETDVLMCRMLETELQNVGYEVSVARDGEDALALIRSMRPDLALLDVATPGVNGLDVAHRIRKDPWTVAVSVILTSAKERADRMEGIAAGADDYVVKPFEMNELLARIQAVLKRSKELRTFSSLTGLPGYVAVEEEIENRLASEIDLAVLFIDVDNFKAYNEYYGFDRGDRVLRMSGQLIRDVSETVAGEGCFAGHLGADLFAVVSVPSMIEALAEALIGRFDTEAPSFYDPEDRDRGFIEVTNRRGESVRYPLLSISIGAASSEKRRFSHYAEVVSVATEMTDFTKRTPGSAWAMDRRTN
jgi:DNA-binding response OmpR family regulator